MEIKPKPNETKPEAKDKPTDAKAPAAPPITADTPNNSDFKALETKVQSLTDALNPLVEALKPKPPTTTPIDPNKVKLEAIYNEVLAPLIPKEKYDSMTLEAKAGAYEVLKLQKSKTDAVPTGAPYVAPAANIPPPSSSIPTGILKLYNWENGIPQAPISLRPVMTSVRKQPTITPKTPGGKKT